ncbi:MAG TPA: 4-hydroxy-3-methylbut-2-enyl diphosphate reductase [Eubacteriales bacterium]|nr:4-hydroxy-3-methylbut-2-enyl diphosphate reductase [Eubacteriales bacterium]HRU84103.1 4-hydroxy-3-methylbut-2-enyl diphosphate reductase [Eubacteriales bacterium]
MPKITLSKHAGFCFGVENAIKTAVGALGKGKRVVSFGELIHNEKVVAALKEQGIGVINDVSEADKDTLVVIRAHGLPAAVIEELKSRAHQVLDATCPFVKKIHTIVEKAKSEGKDVFVAGEKDHPEVVGILSYAGEGARTVSQEEIPFPIVRPSVLVAQTTLSADKFDALGKNVQNMCRSDANLVEIFDTICYTTKGRQKEISDEAKNYQAVFVIGSKSSTNTRRLFETASKHNPNVYYIEDAGGLKPLDYNKFSSILITAGASTPPWLIEEVIKFMSETPSTVAADTEELKMTVESVETTEAAAPAETQVAAPEQAAAPEVIATAPEAAPKQKKADMTMEDVMAGKSIGGFMSYTDGKRVTCRVAYAKDDGIYVSIGGKKDGFIESAEASLDTPYNPEDYKEGIEFFAVITDAHATPYIKLSKKKVDEKIKADEESEKIVNADTFDVLIDKVEKGGLSGRVGSFKVFIPASQIRIGFVKNLEEYVGKTLKVQKIEPKVKEGEEEVRRNKKSIVASHRVILERERDEKEDSFWNSIHVNDIVTGKVKRFTNFGAFVSVRGFDCLAHISELSWKKISDPSEVLTLGESYDFVILKFDRETKKISLGYKQLQKGIYELAAEKYPVGTVIKGKVERIYPFGAFIYIEEGVDGLVHVSQISNNWIKDANEVLKVGQEVEAKITSFEGNRITLSMKELITESQPEETAATEEEGQKPSPKKGTARFQRKEATPGEAPERARRPRRDDAKTAGSEPREWHTDNGTATIGDILKNLDIKLDDEGDQT